MRHWIGFLGVTAVVIAGFTAAALAGEPMFVPWLVADDPGDEVIRDYYERAERDELEPPALVDLGTMLFYRGFPKDAIRFYRRALDADKGFYEAWFLIGLVEHSRGELRNAEQAYQRCLKQRPGHGWANFYYGLLEEQAGHAGKAISHYEQAFKSAPELADPTVNPEILSSELALGAQLRTIDRTSFTGRLPMRYMEPDQVEAAFAAVHGPRDEDAGAEGADAAAAADTSAAEAAPAGNVPPPPAVQPTPRAAPTAQPMPPPRRVPTRAPATPPPASPGARELQEETPYGSPPVRQTSDEAHLLPHTDALWRLAATLA